ACSCTAPFVWNNEVGLGARSSPDPPGTVFKACRGLNRLLTDSPKRGVGVGMQRRTCGTVFTPPFWLFVGTRLSPARAFPYPDVDECNTRRRYACASPRASRRCPARCLRGPLSRRHR